MICKAIKTALSVQYTSNRKDLVCMKNDYTEEYKKIGLKIAYYRKLKGLTQEELAEKIHVATNFIGMIEAPNIYKPISLYTLFRIANALDIPPHKFLEFD